MGRNADNADTRDMRILYTRAEVVDPEAPPWSNMRQGFVWRVDE